jgi:hypothetical protein
LEHITACNELYSTGFIDESEILFEVKRGKIIHVSEISNYIDHPNKINRRLQDTMSNVIFRELQKLDWKKLDEYDCAQNYVIAINENRKVSHVGMVDYEEDEIQEFWDRRDYNYCIRKLLKGLRDLEFDILKKAGQKIPEKVYIEVWYERENNKLEN